LAGTVDVVTIVPFEPSLAPAFGALNRAWIERFFRLEAADRELLDDAEEAIIRPGGQIFFAIEGGTVVGTVAAIRTAHDTFELGKMAVDPAYQGRGLGARLGQAVIDHCRAVGAARIYLETNSRLANAIRLYERLGFVHATPLHASAYARADVHMELRLDAP